MENNNISLEIPFRLTEDAVTEIKRLIAEQQLECSTALRVGVKGGGCSGFSYMIDFDTSSENDIVFEQDGIKLLLDKRHVIYVLGMEVHFQSGLNARGFVFQNPNAKSTCGCGTSFSA